MKLPDYLNNPTIQLLEKIQASMPQIPTSVQRATELNSKIPTVYNDLLSDIENRILNINLSKSDKERQAHRVQKFIAENKKLISTINSTVDDIDNDIYDPNSKNISYIKDNVRSFNYLMDDTIVNKSLRNRFNDLLNKCNYHNAKEVRDWLAFLITLLGFILTFLPS